MSKEIKVLASIGITIVVISILAFLNCRRLSGNATPAIFGYILMYVMIRAVWKIPSKNKENGTH